MCAVHKNTTPPKRTLRHSTLHSSLAALLPISIPYRLAEDKGSLFLGIRVDMANHDEGATPTEVLLGAARINNLDLLKECLSANDGSSALLNSTDSMGNSALHNAAKNGCLECLDYLLDQEGVDLDLRNRMDGDTPLHLAVRYSKTDREAALEIGTTRFNRRNVITS